MKPRVRVAAGTTAFPNPSVPTTRAMPAMAPAVPRPRANFDGGRAHRRMRNYQPSSADINTMLAADGNLLRRRVRDLCRNNAYGAAARESFVAATVGTGIKLSWVVDDPDLKKQLARLWLDWTWQADADGLSDWEGIQATVARELFEPGECFVRLRYRYPTDSLAVPLQLQVLPSEMLAYEKTETLPSGRLIEQGIERDILGRRVAYWFWRKHPGDGTAYTEVVGNEQVPVPASEVLHIFRVEHAGQRRGVPWPAAVVITGRMIDDYDDAELERMRSTALFAGFVTEPTGDQVFTPAEAGTGIATDDMGALAGGMDPDDAPLIPLEPGLFQRLRPGESVEFSKPPDVGGTYQDFECRNLCKIAIGLGVPYAVVTGDLKGATYSSDRSAMIRFRQRIEQVQHSTLVFQLCRSVMTA